MDENGMKFNETQIDDLTKAMFDDADPDHRGGDANNFFTDQKKYFYNLQQLHTRLSPIN
jgi:hypothetical protein